MNTACPAHKSEAAAARRRAFPIRYMYARPGIGSGADDIRQRYHDMKATCHQRRLPVCSFDEFQQLARHIRTSSSRHLADVEFFESVSILRGLPPRCVGGFSQHHVVREIDRRTASLLDW